MRICVVCGSFPQSYPHFSVTNIEIRKYYVTHSLQETYEKYGSKSKTKQGFRNLIDQSYLHLPKYSKTKKQWFLKDLQIYKNSPNMVLRNEKSVPNK